jgi:hypothetical protein
VHNRQHHHADKDGDTGRQQEIARLDGEVCGDVALRHDWLPSRFGDDRYPQTWASSRSRSGYSTVPVAARFVRECAEWSVHS